MDIQRRITSVGVIVLLAGSLASCSGGSTPDGSSADDQGCAALTGRLDEARLAVKLSKELSTHADSAGGENVTDAETAEIADHESELAAAEDAATAANCL